MKTMNNEKTNANGYSNDMDYLVEKMKQRDAQQKKTYRRFYIMMIILVVFYALLLLVNPDPELTISTRIAGFCYVVAFLMGAYFFRLEQKAMEKIDYTESLLQVMQNAVERYRPFKKGFFRFLLVPLFIDFGLTISGPARYMPETWSTVHRIVIIQVVYWSIMCIAALIGYLIWRNRVKPYREAVARLIEELESE